MTFCTAIPSRAVFPRTPATPWLVGRAATGPLPDLSPSWFWAHPTRALFLVAPHSFRQMAVGGPHVPWRVFSIGRSLSAWVWSYASNLVSWHPVFPAFYLRRDEYDRDSRYLVVHIDSRGEPRVVTLPGGVNAYPPYPTWAPHLPLLVYYDADEPDTLQLLPLFRSSPVRVPLPHPRDTETLIYYRTPRVLWVRPAPWFLALRGREAFLVHALRRTVRAFEPGRPLVFPDKPGGAEYLLALAPEDRQVLLFPLPRGRPLSVSLPVVPQDADAHPSGRWVWVQHPEGGGLWVPSWRRSAVRRLWTAVTEDPRRRAVAWHPRLPLLLMEDRQTGKFGFLVVAGEEVHLRWEPDPPLVPEGHSALWHSRLPLLAFRDFHHKHLLVYQFSPAGVVHRSFRLAQGDDDGIRFFQWHPWEPRLQVLTRGGQMWEVTLWGSPRRLWDGSDLVPPHAVLHRTAYGLVLTGTGARWVWLR